MGLTVEQITRHKCKVTPKDSTRQDGVALGELLDFLTTAQAHGIPDKANIRLESGEYLRVIVVEWKEER